MTEDSKQRIEPEAFAPASNQTKKHQQQSPASSQYDNEHIKKSALTWVIPAALLIVALVIVVVPVFNSGGNKSAPLSTTSDTANSTQESNQELALASPEETPWADAQLLKARRDTQEILAELLGVQKRLEDVNVEQWAADEFMDIKSMAETGDAFYQERQFEQSLLSYTEGLDKALRLDASVPDVALEYQQKGQSLLEQNQTAEAIDALELANLLMPDSEEIINLLNQASVREQILTLIDQSSSLARSEDKLESARQLLINAQTLDTAYPPVKALIAEIDQKIVEREFRSYMSEGFTALGAGNYQRATRAFNQAASLKPGYTATDEALQQVEAAKLNTKRQASLDKAIRLESEEDWQTALKLYSNLLNEDSSLTSAQLGKIRSQTRFKLDSDIESIINNPLTLQSESKWQSASTTLADARGIINPGMRLKKQIETLQNILRTARTPVVLKINSDGLTNVEIYRVGKLGTFTEQAMNLNPGKYVIVGKRDGYQDIRVELAIDGSQPEITVPIICQQAI